MRLKKTAIVLLLTLNAVLLVVLASIVFEPTEALAQARGSRGVKYATVTAEYTGGTDAVFLLHSEKHVLSVLIPEQNQSGRLYMADSRDVLTDLNR